MAHDTRFDRLLRAPELQSLVHARRARETRPGLIKRFSGSISGIPIRIRAPWILRSSAGSLMRGADRSGLRRTLLTSAALLPCALMMTTLTPQTANAGCSVTGTTTLVSCDQAGVFVSMTHGTGSLSVDSVTTRSVTYASPTAVGTYDQTVTLTGSTALDNPTYSALVMQFGTDQSSNPIDVTVNATLTIAADVTANTGGGGGFGTIWVRNDHGGVISIDNSGILTGTATSPTDNAPTLSATSNNGDVTVTNRGSVSSTNNRGILADGNGPGLTADTAKVTNTATGVVSAYTAGIRINNDLGSGIISNEGSVTSTLRQGLIAWVNVGEASITNSGTVISGNDNAVYAAVGTGTANVVNTGTVTAQGDPSLDADHAAIATPDGYNGLRGLIYSAGSVNITNDTGGTVTATRDSAILAQTPLGDVTIINHGALTGQVGIKVDSGLGVDGSDATVSTVTGSISITNSGTVTATGIAVAMDGTTNILNTSGTLTTSGTIAVLTGNGDSTLTVTGTIAAATSGDTAIAMGSGHNRLVLSDTATLVGKVTNLSSDNTLELNGSATGTLDVSAVGTSGAFQGFAHLIKSGSGQWTVTGSGGSLTESLAVEDGTLVLTGTLHVAQASVGTALIGFSIPTSGSLEITGSLTADAFTLHNGWVTVSDGGTLTTGLSIGAGAVVADGPATIGVVSVKGQGSSWTDVGASVTLGGHGAGALIVTDGASVAVNQLTAAAELGSTATLILSGTGSQLISQGSIILGGVPGSSASILVEKGASLETVGGHNPPSEPGGSLYINEGAVLFTGAGTSVRIGTRNSGTPQSWETADGWFALGKGVTVVSDGATLESDGGYVEGNATGGGALMVVTGKDTSWDSHLCLYVGGNGNGTAGDGGLIIADGAKVSTTIAAVGVDAGTHGVLLLTGTGSSLTVTPHASFLGNAYAGSDGDGLIVVQDGATLSVANQLHIGYSNTSSGRLVIGAVEGAGPHAPGTVTTGAGIEFGDGDAALVFNHTSTDLTFANILSSRSLGDGEIRVLAGTTNLTANSPDFSGTVIVTGGALKVNGDLSGGAVRVSDGGLLGGSGRVRSLDLQAGGILSPGTSPGTLTVVHDVNFATNSITLAELTATENDKVLVTLGNALIQDGARLILSVAPGTTLGTAYTLVETQSGTVTTLGSGFVVTVAQNYPLLATAVHYSPDTAAISFSGVTTPWSGFTRTVNQGAAANAVQSLGAANPVYAAAVFLSPAQVNPAFNLMSGEVNATAKGLFITQSQFLRDAVMNRLASAGRPEGAGEGPLAPLAIADPAAATGLMPVKAGAPEIEPRAMVWAQGFGAWGSTEATINAASLSSSTGGFFIGADTRVSDWRLGFVTGYSQTNFDVSSRAASGSADSYHLGLYAGSAWGAVNVRLGAAYSWNDVTTSRVASLPTAQKLSASSTFGTGQVFGEIGYGFVAPALNFEPFAGLAYVSLNTDAFTETGGPAALTAGSQTTGVTSTTLGVRAAARVDLATLPTTLKAMLGWRHAFGDVTPETVTRFASGGVPFSVQGLPIAEDALLLDLGLDLALARNITLGVAYNGQYGDGVTEQIFRATFGMKF